MTSHLHAHVTATSTDCDGPLDTDYVICLNDEEITEHEKAAGVNDFHDLYFKARVLGHLATFCPEQQQKIVIDAEGIETQETTEEGYRHSQARWCEDPDCDTDERSRRDHFAEAMGY